MLRYNVLLQNLEIRTRTLLPSLPFFLQSSAEDSTTVYTAISRGIFRTIKFESDLKAATEIIFSELKR